MKPFTNEEVVESLRDDLLHGTVTSCLFLESIDQIKDHLKEQKRLELADLIKSKLIPRAVDDLTKKNIFDTDGGLTYLGLAHVALFVKEHNIITKMNDPELAAQEKTSTDEIKAMVALSLSKFSIEEIIECYNARKHKILTYYLTKNLNDDGLKKILEYDLISRDNLITEKGWFVIKWYIDLHKNPVKKSETEAKATQSKWWEFWK
jgi:hypothetical protein